MKDVQIALLSIIFTLILIFCCTSSSAQWTLLPHPGPLPNHLLDVYFINKDTGFAVGTGNNPCLFRTTNGGNSWVNKGENSFWNFYSIAFFNDSVGIVGTYGLFRTTNAGITWDSVPLAANTPFFFVCASTDSIGHALGYNNKVYKSTNCGATWSVLQSNGIPSGITYHGMSFANADTGLIVGGSSTVLRTVDGGDNWTMLSGNLTLSYECVAYKDNMNAYIGSMERVIKVHNTYVSAPISVIPSGMFQDIYFINANDGYMVGHSQGKGIIFKTNDGGASWSLDSQVPTSGVNSLQAVYFVNINIGYAVGYDGTLLKFVDPNIGIVNPEINLHKGYGFFPNPTADNLFLTSDHSLYQIFSSNGQLIKEVKTGSNTELISLSFLSNGVYYIRVISNRINYISLLFKI